MRRILIATDGSPNAEAATRYALTLAPDSSQLHACYVTPPPDRAAPDGRDALNRAQSVARERGLWLDLHLVEGEPVKELIACAARLHADGIVIATRGRGTAVESPFGSTARALLRRAEIPIFTVSPSWIAPHARGTERILVGFDGSAASVEVSETALVLARQWNAKIDFVYVLDADRIVDGDGAKALAAMVLGAVATHASNRGVSSTQHIVKGTVAPALLQFAAEKKSDLIALGTRGRSGFDRLIVGSVAESVAAASPAAVLVVRDRSTYLGAGYSKGAANLEEHAQADSRRRR